MIRNQARPGLCGLFVVAFTTVHAQNPFATIGRSAEIVTLGQGRYQEVFENDTLRKVGAFVYNTVTGEAYRFAFQEQEKDDEVHGATGTRYAFEYRMHDLRVGRFLSLDPLAAKYPFFSPYAFSGNRVIDAFELEGLEPVVRNVPGKPGAVTAAPLAEDDDPGLAEGDFGAFNGTSANYHCGVVDNDGSVTGSGWYPTEDYMNFAFGPSSGSWQGGFDNTFQVNEQTFPRELPFERYGGIDPNSGRNDALFNEVLSQYSYFPGQPQGIIPDYTFENILMLGRGFSSPRPNYVNLASPGRTAHILAGDATGGGHSWFSSWTSFTNGLRGSKSMFPATWSEGRIMHAASDVATGNPWRQLTGPVGSWVTRGGGLSRFEVIGSFQGVKIKVITTAEDIITAYPIR